MLSRCPMSRYRPGGHRGNHHGPSSRSHAVPHDMGPVRFPRAPSRPQESSHAFNSQNFVSTPSAQPGGSSILSMVAESLSKDNLTGGYQYLQPGWLNTAMTNGGSSNNDEERFRRQNAPANYRSRTSRPPLLPFPPGQERRQNPPATPQRHQRQAQFGARKGADDSGELQTLEDRMAEIQKQLDMLHEEEMREKAKAAARIPSSRRDSYAAASSSSFDPVSQERKDRELARMDALLQKRTKSDIPERRYEPRPRNSPPRRRARERSPRDHRPSSRTSHSTRHSSRSREESSHRQMRREQHRSPSPKRSRRDGAEHRRREETTTSGRTSVVSSASGRRRSREKREEGRREEDRKSDGGERVSSRGEKREERKADEKKPAEKKVLKLDEGDSERRKRIIASLSSVSERRNKRYETTASEEDESAVDELIDKMLKEKGEELREVPPFHTTLSEVLAKLLVAPKQKRVVQKYRHSEKKIPYADASPNLEFFRRKPKDQKSFGVFQKLCDERKSCSGVVKKEIKEEM